MKYPDINDMDAMTPRSKYYGFTSPETCDLFGFQMSEMPKVMNRRWYQIEHVLEWQTVADSFTWIRDKKKTGKVFENPKEGTTDKVDFCVYWKGTWTGANPKAFSIDQSAPQTVEQHLSEAYPSLQHTPHEFVWLEATINSPMWAYKAADEDSGIFSTKSKRLEIEGGPRRRKNIDTTKESYVDLKNLLGARKYMRNPDIAKILKKQDAWVSQGMGALWKEYMDERFRIAHARTEKDMDTYIKMLRNAWSRGPTTDPAQKAFAQQIGKLNSEWMKEKRNPWRKPW
ncbi:hypothetical protein P171DRAFT_480661 [Karstenula rhodostoma CBS 690.94]|uniref:Uncharacterized protein n=1 Tax=Karstenula rhodostoma CBS 690.94 TaxID=1392251 RepID=A0A9P4PSV5_9PLEO|nr:hypothetical protein P171DRAFT_480661 [Karstenula rhodostoma CBS 690.94]